MSCSSQWLNPRSGSWEPPICSQFAQKLWVTWGPTTCNWHLKGGASESCGTEPLTCGTQRVSVRIEWNRRTSCWCWRIGWYGKNPTHLVSEILYIRVKENTVCFPLDTFTELWRERLLASIFPHQRRTTCYKSNSHHFGTVFENGVNFYTYTNGYTI